MSNIKAKKLKIEVCSDFEMSDLSSSNIDKEETSDSEDELGNQNNKFEKKRKKEKIMQQRNSVDGEETGSETFPASNTPAAIDEQEKMRRRLQFFFMNPIEKWQAKRR